LLLYAGEQKKANTFLFYFQKNMTSQNRQESNPVLALKKEGGDSKLAGRQGVWYNNMIQIQ
jgi:hypothetical protein